MKFRGISVVVIFFMVALGMAVAPAILGPAMNAAYKQKLDTLLPSGLESSIGAATLESIADPRVLMSKEAMAELKSAFSTIEEKQPALFDETVQAIRTALQSGLKVLFLIGSAALLIAFLFIVTIPKVPIESEE